MCDHLFLNSDYNTLICTLCGLERECAIMSIQGYTENMPLELGYSRYNRMANLLKQLFQPTLYGTPNSRVVYEVMKQTFATGEELLVWLSKLQVKNKRYQNAHYYFTVHKPYQVPTPPCQRKMRAMMSLFTKLEHRFDGWSHPYKSFFSYNWLLRQFLEEFQLGVYLQFVKQIKCPKRVALYESMYNFFTSSGNAGGDVDVFQRSQKQLYEPQGDVYSYPLGRQYVLSRLAKNYPNNLETAT